MNALEWAVVRVDPMQQVLELQDLKPLLADWEWPTGPISSSALAGLDQLILDQVLELLIRQRLKMYQGNKTKAAESLGISRGTFRAWCKKYGIESEE